MKLIKSYLESRLKTADPAVLAAFQAVPREYFQYMYSEHHTMCGDAYEIRTQAMGDRVGIGPVGLSRPGLHDPGR